MKLELEQSAEKVGTDAERRLARALARRCRGSLAWFGEAWPAVEQELCVRGVERPTRVQFPGERGPTHVAEPRDGAFDTVLMLQSLERRPEGQRAGLVDAAWRLIAPNGRLLVCVPNGDLLDHGGASRVTRRGLKRLLQRIDRPHLIKDQPLRWIAMYLDVRPRLDRATHDRHLVIAGLCRGNVLELGCNYGHLCDAIARRGVRVEGLDKSGLKVDRARELFPGIVFRQADILELRPEPRFDTVVLSEVLEHVPPAVGDRILDRAWAAVAPGGRLIVSVPNEDCVPHANHVREFDRDDLARILRSFAEPQLVDEQPFKWLLMYVDRP